MYKSHVNNEEDTTTAHIQVRPNIRGSILVQQQQQQLRNGRKWQKKKEEENHNTIAYNCYYQRMCVLLAHSLPASQHDIWNWSSNQFLWSVDESFVWFSYLLLLFCVFVSVPSCSYLLFTKRCGFVLVFLVGLFFMCVFFYLVCCMLDRANLSAFLIADINHTHDQQQLILLLCAYRIKKKKTKNFHTTWVSW